MTDVLVVDDTPDCREPLARFLNLSGYQVATAANGREALAYLRNHHADVVLLDLMMPVMDGVSFLRELRKNHLWHDLPVIVVTALSEGRMLDEASGLGIRGTLIKSRFSVDELLQQLEDAGAPAEH